MEDLLQKIIVVLHHLRAMAKEDGYIDVGGFVVETPEKLIEKAKKLFKQDNTELPMPFVNQVLSELIGEPLKKKKRY